jgi:hypothetical protein
MQYSVYPGWHGMDLLASFVSPKNGGVAGSMSKLFKPEFLNAFELYRTYISSFIISGNPNTASQPPHTTVLKRIEWPKLSLQPTSQRFGSVLNIDEEGATIVEDRTLPKLNCEWFQLLQQKGTVLLGYSPPGAAPAKYDEVFSGKVPSVMIETVEPFPADVGPTVPLNEIVGTILRDSNVTAYNRLQELLL